MVLFFSLFLFNQEIKVYDTTLRNSFESTTTRNDSSMVVPVLDATHQGTPGKVGVAQQSKFILNFLWQEEKGGVLPREVMHALMRNKVLFLYGLTLEYTFCLQLIACRCLGGSSPSSLHTGMFYL